MKRKDLRGRIIPTTIGNTSNYIYLDSYEEQFDGKKTDMERRISVTDYALMNNACIYDKHADDNGYKTRTGKLATSVWLCSAEDKSRVQCISRSGAWISIQTVLKNLGLCPSLHYGLPSQEEEIDIREVKDAEGKIIYHTLQIGEYSKTKVDETLSEILESLYNGGKIKDGISCTGRWYSGNGQKKEYQNYAGKHSPEFEYQGVRYVRVISYPNYEENRYSDGTITGKTGTVRWVKVEPISFVIKNWNEMPKYINPEGNGQAESFDLRAEEAVTSNIPFYPNSSNKNNEEWKNSSIRGFFNGIDVRNIDQNGAPNGGNFTGECNFLNEAFNLSRQPMIEYTIPDSETEIPDDAFNGCITLKKIVIHSGVKSIGKRAFDGLDFKYAYKTHTGELVFASELPKNKAEYKEAIELGKIEKFFTGIDYNTILAQREKLDVIANFSEILAKHKFSIPYAYGLALVQSGNFKLFCENSDFRFFKNEIPNINEMLLNFPEEERVDFYKFATALGCFSAGKMLDKKEKETEVIFAQKASSFLAQLLKTEEMKLR